MSPFQADHELCNYIIYKQTKYVWVLAITFPTCGSMESPPTHGPTTAQLVLPALVVHVHDGAGTAALIVG